MIHWTRREALRSAGAVVALPFLESIAGATSYSRRARLICIEMVYGSAGSTKYGVAKNLWAPASTGASFDLSQGSLSPLQRFHKYLTIISNTDIKNAKAHSRLEVGADHMRSSAAFLTQSVPKRTLGTDVRAGISLDQLVAQRFGRDTPIPSLQLCIEDVGHSSDFGTGYSSVYRDTISWADPTTPLPMINNPRAVFDQLFRVSQSYGAHSTSILDWVLHEIPRVSRNLNSSDRQRLDSYLTDIRELERRIQAIEEFNNSGENRSFPSSALAVPDEFEEHVRLMFDLQIQALAAGITRVSAFKMALDGIPRTYPRSGVSESFHPASHHGEREGKIEQFAQINRYHVGLLAVLLERLESLQEGEKNLLEKTIVLYGSPMGDSNFHNHQKCPLFFAGLGDGALQGQLHLKAADGTPMANAFLGLLHGLGIDDVTAFGDSTAPLF
jgi:hypothetical protein